MRFWFTPSTEVPLREQIVQQVRLGILDGQLRPGERLPSTRHFARRYGMHANTVSAAFQQLRDEGWTAARHGSGTFVAMQPRPAKDSQADPSGMPLSPDVRLNMALLHAVRMANALKVSRDELYRRIDALLDAARLPVRHILVEPDATLARIVQHEIAKQTGLHLPHLRMQTADFPRRLQRALQGATAVVLPSKAAAAYAVLPPAQVAPLEIEPVSTALATQLPSDRSYLVAVVSCWPAFLQIARTMLVSAGFTDESLLSRDTALRTWRDGLHLAEAVVCDSLTAEALPPQHRVLAFPIVARASMAQLQELQM